MYQINAEEVQTSIIESTVEKQKEIDFDEEIDLDSKYCPILQRTIGERR